MLSASLWTKLQQQSREIAELEQKLFRISADKDYNEAQFRQLESANITDGELAQLEDEQKQLANAEEIKSGLSSAEELYSPSSDSLSIDAALKEADRLLSRVGKYVPAASELSERVDSCRRELDDIFSEVSSLNSRVDVSQERLEQVEDRMSLLYSLMQKHACRTEAELIAVRDNLSEALYDSTALEEKLASLRDEISSTRHELEKVAAELHQARVQASGPFAEEMTAAIRGLELSYAAFDVQISETQPGQYGSDAVTFRFSATGRNMTDLAKCASGGELSRIMLALKAMRARYVNMPTMVFDEIDTGVSGSVADKMGSMICDMGSYMQVFAITHLPQVAAKGSAHYMVSKDIDPVTSVAVSKIEKLSHEERVLEIARMLSGSTLTDAAIANAKSLLGSGR